jgi:hypothetical protein
MAGTRASVKRNTSVPPREAAWLAAAQAEYVPRNRHGVVGFGVGRIRSRGEDQRRRGLVVFVRRKELAPARPIEPLSVGGTIVMPDIRAVGASVATAGTGFSPNGLFVGAPILSRQDNRKDVYGGVGALFGGGASPTHLITAGHLFAKGAGATLLAGPPGGPIVEIGTLVTNGLDLANGAVDAALIALGPKGTQLAQSSRAQSPTPLQAIDAPSAGDRVRCFSSRSGDWTQTTRIDHLTGAQFQLTSARRGTYWLTNLFRTVHLIVASGDSGTGLIEVDRPGHVVGLCSGGDAGGAIFQPIASAIHALGITQPIWR